MPELVFPPLIFFPFFSFSRLKKRNNPMDSILGNQKKNNETR